MFPSRIASVLGGGIGLQNNYSLSLDGTNDFVDCGTSLGTALGDNYAGSLSVSMWFKNGGANDDGLLDIGAGTGAGEFFISLGSSSKLYFNLNAGGWSRSVTFTDTSSWHHLGCVYTVGSESDSLLYLDGVSVGGTTGTFPSASDMDFGTNNKLVIGNFWDRSSYHFVGNIDEVSIWNKALSAGDISALYQARGTANLNDDGNSANLKGWWRMGDGVLDDFNLIADQSNTGTAQMFTNPDFTSNVTGWGGTSNCSLAFSSGSLRQTSSSAANSQFTPSSSGFSATTTAIRVEAKCTIISGTQTPRFEIRDGANANWVYNSGTTDGAVITFDFYMVGANDEANVHIQLRGSSSGVADWDYIKMTKYDGNAGIMTNMASDDIVKDTP